MQTSRQRQEVVIVGRSCRLPGASSADELWANLIDGRCSVSSVPDDRWSKAKHGHPRPKEPGKSYTWAAGTLGDIWGFDPSVFGISPREAEQMDPHQRLMLELTWEALEDAGIRRSDVAGSDVGVFVGASSPEFSSIRSTDMAAGDAYTATGGALSIVSNRISHAFDFKGPSFTVDTACSSSLVALHQAMEALNSGRIDTAIVGGINLLLSPFGFVAFSQASMLSPTGLCQTFDAKADGYVRAEGAVVLVLRTAEKAAKDASRVYARIATSGVNSDGRTNGIALPSKFAQAKLLRELYDEAGIEPDRIAFVEAHGTGTRVGDPIEAATIGEVLGQGRSTPLPVGSIKSNIGHLEPASGLAGMLKAMMALEHDLLPPSINFSEPNPDIAFDELNLRVCTAPTALKRDGRTRYAGVNSFGFGGTNAHVVLADPAPATARKGTAKQYSSGSDRFSLSGASRTAIRDLARLHADALADATSEDVQEVAAAVAHRRETLAERLVVDWQSPRDLVRRLERVADREDDVPGVTWGTVTEADAPVAFVFSGNGGQWPGMGRAAYQTNRRFREAFDEVDGLFDAQFGWSITEALFAADLEERLPLTSVAQPLIFAIQIATVRALAADGLRPSFVLGHSVGEIAAAVASGALSLRDGVAVIHARSAHQELVRDTGRMAVVVGSREQVDDLASGFAGVEVAAVNSPRTYTVAGPTDAIKALGQAARKRRMVFRQLELDYPFHCALIDPVHDPLMRDLGSMKGQAGAITMVSTVTGEPVDGSALDATYWWRNVREPVSFAPAVEAAARAGARVFVEIGPRSVLLSAIGETVEPTSLPFAAIGVLERHEDGEEPDQIRAAAVNAFVRGAAIDRAALFGPEPTRPVVLPGYPWQHRDFRITASPEIVGSTIMTEWHRLIGARNTIDGTEWLGQLDTSAVPELADHQVGGQAILPAAAFIEIALTVARDWFGSEDAALLDIEIALPLALEADRAREVKARLSPNTNTVEILSRPRLSKAEWQIHATAKITAGGEDNVLPVRPAESGTAIPAERVYHAAEAVGLDYGPAFRLVSGIERLGPDRIAVSLAASAPAPGYRLDPAKLDACFHGLFILFADLGAEKRGTAYLPVRFGTVRVPQPGAVATDALIELRKVGERSILADFTLFDADGVAVAHLADARFQAARVRRSNHLADRALVFNAVKADGAVLGEAGVDAAPAAIADLARKLGIEAEDGSEPAEQLLLEGWATAMSYELARGLDPSGTVTPDYVAGLAPHLSSWLANLLHVLEVNGLATAGEAGWTIADESGLPSAETILRTLGAENPNRSAELLLAGSLTATAAKPGALDDGADPSPSSGAVDGYDLGGSSARDAAETVARLVTESGILSQPGRAVRVLQVGFGPLSQLMQDAVSAAGGRLTVFDPDARRLERARLAIGSGSGLSYAGSPADLAPAGFDLVVAANSLHRLGRGASLVDLRGAMAPGALLLAAEPLPSHFRDLALGLSVDWFEGGAAAEFPVSPLRTEEAWRHELSGVGLAEATTLPVLTGHEVAILLGASAPALAVAAPGQERVLRVVDGGGSAALARRLEAALAGDHRVLLGHEAEIVADTVLFLGAGSDRDDDVAVTRDLCMAMKSCAEDCARDKAEFWLLTEGATAEDGAADPVAAACLAFSRTLANETAGLAVRRVAVSRDLRGDDVTDAVAALLRSEQTETDFLLGAGGCEVLRVETLRPADLSSGESAVAKLERGTAGGLAGLAWVAAPPVTAGEGEVEIAVSATGLNFRDVMWAMSLLPDDILEDGFAGPTLGLECAGTVAAVGPGVTRFKVGDPVIAFAPSAFATRVAVPQAVVAKVPAGLELEAAATIPVPFLTAFYGLVTLAGLKRGETVLIHGAAGGVGLAAIQIAQERGAVIVATAGSREKRDLLRTMGVEYVLNSRSAAFVDDTRRICPGGVDVVLNSLAGEAMERGLSTLKPFGRFIELGKRDYVANTRIGLRPFRRNLSYFGVDVDQLLSDRDRAGEIFGEVIRLVEEGAFKPLPFRVFQASETVDAFRLMQQSGHIGKIVLRPPAGPVPAVNEEEFAFNPDGTHLLTGGFGGFGLEAAIWLADRGVRHLVLTGRRGAESDDARAVVAALEKRGVSVRAAACDVSDEASVRALLEDIRRTMPPLSGVLHAAMVLEDGLAANLTADALERVLTPKLKGAIHLDRLTAADPLDYFVLFSSITTFVGNPGQAAYVAANGYLEGVARARRAAGRPALAVAWGAISDVGVLARQKGLAEALAKRVGVKAMPARDALDLMAQALGQSGRSVMAIGSLDWSAARRLPALSAPTFSALTREGGAAETSDRRTLDLRAIAATQEPETVRRQVVEVIVEEIAAVLRIPKGDVSTAKKLAEVGLDSLMAIELATALQERLELTAPPSGSVGALTVPALAEHLISSVHTGTPDEEARVTQALNDRHAGIALDTEMAPVLEAVAAHGQARKGLLQ